MKTSTKLALGLAAGAAIAAPIFLLAPGSAGKGKKAPFLGRNFAHRGLHTQEVPENSLAAFAQAADAGYAIELDLHLTGDGEVGVFHDDGLGRLCGVDRRVEDMTLQELSELRLLGTDQGIPTFSQVLALVGGRVPLMVELKPGKKRWELCRKTVEELMGYQGSVCIQSFDPLVVTWFRFRAPQYLRGQLAAPASEYPDQPKWKGWAMSHLLLNFLARPQFISYRIGPKPTSVKFCELLGRLTGAMRVAWTSHSQENERGKDAVVFEHYRPLPYFF